MASLTREAAPGIDAAIVLPHTCIVGTCPDSTSTHGAISQDCDYQDRMTAIDEQRFLDFLERGGTELDEFGYRFNCGIHNRWRLGDNVSRSRTGSCERSQHHRHNRFHHFFQYCY